MLLSIFHGDLKNKQQSSWLLSDSPDWEERLSLGVYVDIPDATHKPTVGKFTNRVHLNLGRKQEIR